MKSLKSLFPVFPRNTIEEGPPPGRGWMTQHMEAQHPRLPEWKLTFRTFAIHAPVELSLVTIDILMCMFVDTDISQDTSKSKPHSKMLTEPTVYSL